MGLIKKKRDFLSITDLSAKEIMEVFALAKKLKKQLKDTGSNQPLLASKILAMIFEKPSLRTRLSFEVAMTQFGGHAIYLAPADIGLGVRESVADVAKVTSSMADMIMARTFKHETVEELAKYASVPVINGLSDLEHPCQALSDFFTILEVKGKLISLKLAFVGDGENNLTHSLALGSAIFGMHFSCGAPKGYQMRQDVIKKAKAISGGKTDTLETEDPKEAVQDADIVYTDTWVSMGDEKEAQKRLKVFRSYQVDMELMSLAKEDAIFMHCLPAHRGEEVTADVIDGPQSVVFEEAENRLHVQKALMLWLMGYPGE